MVVFALGVIPDLEYDRTQHTTAPTDRTELFRIVVLLVHQVSLIKDLLRLFKANAVLSFDVTALPAIELAARI
jgi:hypothetical protein